VLCSFALAGPAIGQEGSSSPGAPPATGGPSAGTPSTPPPAATAPVFVPPLPPPPSQTRLPQAFQAPAITPGLNFTITKSLTLSEEYSDNFRLSAVNRESNFRTMLTGGLGLIINLPRTQGTLSSSLGVAHDTVKDEIDPSFFPSFSGSVRHQFTPRLSLTLTDSLVRSDDPNLGDEGGLRRERGTFTSNSFTAAVDWTLDLIALQFYYRNSLFFGSGDEQNTISHVFGTTASTPLGPLMSLTGGYELSLRNTSGGTTTTDTGGTIVTDNRDTGTVLSHRLFGSLSRTLSQYLTAGVSASVSFDDSNINNNNNGNNNGDDDSSSAFGNRIYNVSLFGAYGTPAGLTVSSSVGVSVVDQDNRKPQIAFTTNTAAAYSFAKGQVSLSVSQDFRQTAEEGQNFGLVLSRTITAAFTYPITPFVTFGLRAQYSRNEPTGSGNDVNSEAAEFYTAGANVGWQVLRWLRASLDYTYSLRRNDNSSSLSVSGDTVSRSSTTATNGRDVFENRATLTLSGSF
jgi:hypothetical protein